MTLTDLQDKFSENIAAGMKKGEAALKAGYSKRSASAQASQNLKLPKVQERIQELQDERVKLLNQRFVGVADKAMQELLNVLLDDDTPPQTKTNTAKILLDYGGFKPVDKQETTLTGNLDISERSEIFNQYLNDDDD